MKRQPIEWVDHPTMNPRNTRQLRSLIERPQAAYLWGRKSIIVPRLVGQIFGDGRKLLALLPIMYRPERFVVRVDSKLDTQYGSDWLDAIYDATEDEFYAWPWMRKYGMKWSEDGEGDMDSRIDWGGGSCWHDMKWPRIKRARRRAA